MILKKQLIMNIGKTENDFVMTDIKFLEKLLTNKIDYDIL